MLIFCYGIFALLSGLCGAMIYHSARDFHQESVNQFLIRAGGVLTPVFLLAVLHFGETMKAERAAAHRANLSHLSIGSQARADYCRAYVLMCHFTGR